MICWYTSCMQVNINKISLFHNSGVWKCNFSDKLTIHLEILSIRISKPIICTAPIQIHQSINNSLLPVGYQPYPHICTSYLKLWCFYQFPLVTGRSSVDKRFCDVMWLGIFNRYLERSGIAAECEGAEPSSCS